MFKKIAYTLIALVGITFIFALVMAFLPTQSKVNTKRITREEAAILRQHYSESHHTFTTTDGETLFLRRWNPDSIETVKKDIAILIFHGVTAHSGAYNMAGIPLSKYNQLQTRIF